MPHLYTRTGDNGETGLLGGRRVRKSSVRIEALGWLDQLNSQLGLVRFSNSFPDVEETIERIQRTLFEVGAELADQTDAAQAGVVRISEEDIKFLEEVTDRATAETGSLNRFILPAGSELACQLHIARSICRAAERKVVTLFESEPGNPLLLRFLNRLSHTLFALARVANKRLGIRDELWIPRNGPIKSTSRD